MLSVRTVFSHAVRVGESGLRAGAEDEGGAVGAADGWVPGVQPDTASVATTALTSHSADLATRTTSLVLSLSHLRC
jgi:hypothetical protein